MTGRSLHDALLRVLTDGTLRRRLVDGDLTVGEVLGDEEAAILKRADSERLKRLARFMARHFYRERIVRLFRWSRALSLTRGRDPLMILNSPAFSSVLDSAVLGSPATAEAVAQLVEAQLVEGLNDRPYGADLISYEGTMFRVEAGPRRWDAPAAAHDSVPVRSPHAKLIELDWNLTLLIAGLRAGSPSPPEPVSERTRLLVALSPHGRVTSIRCAEAVSRLLDALDGRKRTAEVASASGLGAADANTLLEKLTEIGAVEWRPAGR